MDAENTILPYLMPADWALHAQSVSRRLDVPSDDPRIPWISFGQLARQDFEPLSPEAFDTTEGEEQIVARALSNLQERSASWQPVDGAGEGNAATGMIAAVDDELSAERIMDKDFMIDAQEMLGTEILAVGIPRRRLLVAIDGRQPESSLTRFGAYNLGQYYSSETESLTSLTFLMGDGEFAGVMQFGD